MRSFYWALSILISVCVLSPAQLEHFTSSRLCFEGVLRGRFVPRSWFDHVPAGTVLVGTRLFRTWSHYKKWCVPRTCSVLRTCSRWNCTENKWERPVCLYGSMGLFTKEWIMICRPKLMRNVTGFLPILEDKSRNLFVATPAKERSDRAGGGFGFMIWTIRLFMRQCCRIQKSEILLGNKIWKNGIHKAIKSSISQKGSFIFYNSENLKFYSI